MTTLPLKFTVTYVSGESCSRKNGTKEMSSAIECIRSVFPLCAIETIRLDQCATLQVVITASASDIELPIWSGRQQNLFRKYRVKRRKTMKDIVANLKTVKESLRAGRSPASALLEQTTKDAKRLSTKHEAKRHPPSPLIRRGKEVLTAS
eukprot:scaffold3001_cov122-Cylindrotheca_fusiformis.AAC.14